jgi:3-dehydroquinate dehydratase type I
MLKARNLEIGSGRPKIICPIMKKTQEEILKDALEMKRHAADAAEFRADAWEDVRDPAKLDALMKSLRKVLGELPLLFTLRTKAEGGCLEVTGEEYADICRAAVRSGEADLIDLEFRRKQEMLRKEAQAAGVRVIYSFHDFEKTLPKSEMTGLLLEMEKQGADIAKIAVMPRNETDVLNLLMAGFDAYLQMSIPVIFISMGELGVLSRVGGERFGSSMTFASIGTASAPGQLMADDLAAILKELHEERKKSAHIFLTGFMGTGKSSAAKVLGEKTGRPVYELDRMIEEKAGMPIVRIFAEKKEEGFRRIETEVLRSLMGKQPGIVSCGGGIVLSPVNVRLMRTLGVIVLMTASPDTICERLKGETDMRPLLRGEDSREKIRALMEARADAYAEAADVTEPTDGREIDTICAEILFGVEKHGEVL